LQSTIVATSFRFLILGSLLIRNCAATPGDRFCAPLIQELVYQMQRGSLGFIKDPLAEAIRSAVGSGDARFTTDEWVQDFHEDVVNFLIDELPSERWMYFERKYGLSTEQVMDILTYYASRHYFNGLSYLGRPRDVLARLSRVAREHRLGEPKEEVSRTYLYYLHNVTRFSVPEMAEQLTKGRGHKVSENEVYQELSELGVSIEAAFERPLSENEHYRILERLNEMGRGEFAAGLPRGNLMEAAKFLGAFQLRRSEIARVLNVGERAFEFIQHYRNEIVRGVPWKRELDAEGRALAESERWNLGQLRSELQILTLFWKRDDLPSQEIADRLNRLFRTLTDSIEYRTQGSVVARARLLELTGVSPKGPDLDHPVYGKLKKDGNLVPGPVLDFLYDNYDNPISDLARELHLSVPALRRFMKRHDVMLVPEQRGKVTLLGQSVRSEMMAEDGILVLLTENFIGFTVRTDSVLEEFAKAQVPDVPQQGTLLAKLRALGIHPGEGAKAKEGNRTAQARIQEALMLIAESKTGIRPRSVSQESEGISLFGLAPTKKTPQLLDTVRIEMMSDDGILKQLTENLLNFTVRTDSVLEDFARIQVPDFQKQARLVDKLRGIGILPNDGAKAKEGIKVAQDRIHEALVLIAESRTGKRPRSVSKKNDGLHLFGLLTQAVREEMMSELGGILGLMTERLKRFVTRTDVALEAFAQEKVSDSKKQSELLGRLATLGIYRSDGHNAKRGNKLSLYRIHEALALIAEAKTGRRSEKISSRAEGILSFDFK
jgi:hypothetical protein